MNKKIRHLYLKLKEKKDINEILRFGIVGGVSTLVHYGIYLLFMHILPDTIAYTIGYLTSFILNYILTAAFTFKQKSTIKRGAGFTLSHIINYSLHIILLNIFLLLGMPAQFAPIPVFAIAIPTNFLLVRFVFKSKFFHK